MGIASELGESMQPAHLIAASMLEVLDVTSSSWRRYFGHGDFEGPLAMVEPPAGLLF
jgi:hypothetical protein